MTSIYTMILVCLCTALFITLDATPVLPSGSESEAVGEQQFDEMTKTFLNDFRKISSIQADNELGKNFASSAVSKNSDPNDDPQEILYNGLNPIPSSIGRRLGEGGEIQSGDELMQTITNLFGTLFSGATKKTENGVHSRNESDKELGQTPLIVISNMFSAFSDPNNGPQTGIKWFKQFLHVFDNLLSVGRKNANPNDEMSQASLKGFNTLFTILREFFEDRESVGNESDGIAVLRTFINVLHAIYLAEFRFVNPKNEFEKAFLDGVDCFFSIIGKSVGNGGDRIQPTDMQTLIKCISSLLSTFTKMVENGERQSTDKIVPAAFLNLFSNILSDVSQAIEPNNEVEQSGLSAVLSTVGRKINGDHGSQIQSDIDINIPKAILNLFGTVGSAPQKKLNPMEELAQILLTLFNTWIPETKNSIGGAQEIRVDTLPTYIAKHFDQSILESMHEEAATVETNMDLTDEAKIQLWGVILGSLA